MRSFLSLGRAYRATVTGGRASASLLGGTREPGANRATAICMLLAVALAALLAGAGGADAASCPNAAFRGGPSARLPDCRAYEMVTPSGTTNGVAVYPYGSSPDGSALLGVSRGAFDGAGDNLGTGSPGNYYLFRRTESGWTTTPVSPPASQFMAPGGSDSFAQSLDQLTTLWFDRGADRPSNSVDMYVERAAGSFADVGPLVPSAASATGEPFLVLGKAGFNFAGGGISADGSRVLFEEQPLAESRWPHDGTVSGPSLLEYIGTGNTEPLLVAVDDAGSLIGQCGASVGQGQSDFPNYSHNAVSADGNTVFFTVYPAGESCSGTAPPIPELFARIDNGLPDAHTVAISEPSLADCETCDTQPAVLSGAEFEGASEDGSKVFFATTQPLLPGAVTSRNLYEYDFNASQGHRVVRVSGGDSTVPSPEARVQGTVVQLAEDGSHLYFVARGVLTATSNGQGQTAQGGADNLYVFERDARFPDGHIAFVADLCSDAGASGSAPDARCSSTLNGIPAENTGNANDLVLWTGSASSSPRGSNTTPDGNFLVFLSHADLTSDDTSSAVQVFEYDARTASLVRVSVGQNGFNNDGNTATLDAHIPAPSYKGKFEPGAYWGQLAISADGSYVFFQSADALTPQAIDGAAQNIYEYHDGNVYLISDGQDLGGGESVQLKSTDASGRDVFFTTSDGLVPADTNAHEDTYDARIEGGFPAPIQPAGCAGDACQGVLSPAPTLLSPGSEFQMGGNPPLSAPVTTKVEVKKRVKTKSKKKETKSKRKVKNKAKRKKAGKSGRVGKGADRIGGRS